MRCLPFGGWNPSFLSPAHQEGLGEPPLDTKPCPSHCSEATSFTSPAPLIQWVSSLICNPFPSQRKHAREHGLGCGCAACSTMPLLPGCSRGQESRAVVEARRPLVVTHRVSRLCSWQESTRQCMVLGSSCFSRHVRQGERLLLVHASNAVCPVSSFVCCSSAVHLWHHGLCYHSLPLPSLPGSWGMCV